MQQRARKGRLLEGEATSLKRERRTEKMKMKEME